MKIVVKNNDEPNLWLPIPSGLVLNHFTANLASKQLKNSGFDITKEQAIRIIDELNRYRRSHPDWVLVEVQSSDGDYVKIKL